jgi:carbon monoxide dehydrogenase subunit G
VITITVCETIDATPDAVWDAIEDIESHTEWMQDAVRIWFTGEQHTGVGATFECLTRVGPLSTLDRFAVTRWEPGRVLGIEHRGAVTGTAEFRLRDTHEGSTRFCWEERLRFPWWFGGVAGEQAAQPVLRSVWRRNVARLKASIEQPG